jgi:hypothetical protein
MALGLEMGSRVPDLETTALGTPRSRSRPTAPFVFDAGRELRHVDD